MATLEEGGVVLNMILGQLVSKSVSLNSERKFNIITYNYSLIFLDGNELMYLPRQILIPDVQYVMDHWPWMVQLRGIFLSLISEKFLKNGSNII